MDSPGTPGETQMETDDIVYPCKGCGEILEEGKAFELAGNRWHIDCFRCNTCGTLLDSDANLLLLGDGSLICNNCTYSCSACGNKIEDLAILTGDQAFCATCFKCRNCKRKIENLRYARTSQGVFCMSCHESLMARRRKKNKAAVRAASANSNGVGGTVVLDKSLPALPPTMIAQSMSSTNDMTDDQASPLSVDDEKGDHTDPTFLGTPHLYFVVENLSVDPGAYGYDRHSIDDTQAGASEAAENDNEYLIPPALDPGSIPILSPLARSRKANEKGPDLTTRLEVKDYTDNPNAQSSAFKDDFRDLVAGSSRSASSDRKAKSRISPHIAFQEKGRQSSSDIAETIRKQRKEPGASTPVSSATSPAVAGHEKSRLSPSYEAADPTQNEGFRLQEAPKRRRSSGSKKGSKDSANYSTQRVPSIEESDQNIPVTDTDNSTSPLSNGAPQIPKRRNSFRKSPLLSSSSSTIQVDIPSRDDSLPKNTLKQQVTRKEVPRPDGEVGDLLQRFHQRNHSGSSLLGRQQSVKEKGISKPIDSFSSNNNIADGPPPRNSNRPRGPIESSQNDSFTAPRHAPPPPPPGQRHKINNDSISSIQSENFHTKDQPGSPVLNHNNLTEDLSNDDEASRALKSEESEGPGLFRRVSKAVKHGRSHSDKISVSSPKWAKSSRNGSIDISSPIITSPDFTEEPAQLRNKLRFAQQRVTELEAEKLALQLKVNGTVDIRQVNTELREKRSTMAFLDTQRDMVMRELEVMTEALARAKDSKEPLRIENLKLEILKDFGTSLYKLKDQLGGKIEELVHQKNELTTEIATLIQMKDKGFQEYETLSTKNTQLSELNNQLIHNIQELYKQGRQPNTTTPGLSPSLNGLGLYTNHNRDRSDNLSLDMRSNLSGGDISISQLSGDTEVEPASMLAAPQVVNIRKMQPKKFNWKKGSHGLAKNVTKGFMGAFTSQNSILREEQLTEGVSYGQVQAGEAPIGVGAISRLGNDQKAQGWGFLNAPKGPSMGKVGTASQGSVTSLPADSAVFGSDLTARCDFEKRVIPSLVSSCIEEVELRGMTQEGIYRKSGSTSQVKTIQAGFEKDYQNYSAEIGDPDLDIHAVTSALKQYFRRLPVPLVPFDSYEGLLEAAATPDDADGGEERARRMKDVVDALPRCHRDCLEFLVFHLVRVMERDEQNLMTSLNLAVVFAPTVMRPETVEKEMSDMQAQRVAVQCLLDMNQAIFAGGDNADE